MARIYQRGGHWYVSMYVRGQEVKKSIRTRHQVVAEKVLKEIHKGIAAERDKKNASQVRSSVLMAFRYACDDLSLESVLGSSIKALAKQLNDADIEVCGTYFLRSGEFLKIGYTSALGRRVSELETSSANKMEVVGFLPGSRELEMRLHRAFHRLRHKGEWFRYESPLVEFVDAVDELVGLRMVGGEAAKLGRKVGELVKSESSRPMQPSEILEEMIRPLRDSNPRPQD